MGNEMDNKWKKKRFLAIFVLVVAVGLVVFAMSGAQLVLKNHQKRFKEFGILKEEGFTSSVYYKTFTLSYAEWNQLKTELVSEGWHPIEPKIELVSPLLVSEDEFQYATEGYSRYETIYYTIIPKACKERIIVMEYDDEVIVHLMIAVHSPWDKELF